MIGLSGCKPPAYRNIEVVREPASPQMVAALITPDDTPGTELTVELESKVRSFDHFDVIEKWDWSNPVTTIANTQHYENGVFFGNPAGHVLIKYSSEEVAHSVWKALLDDKIQDGFAYSVTKSVDLFSEERLPTILADDVAYRCHQYYDRSSWNFCVAQLRYGIYYTQIVRQVSNKARDLSAEEFLGLVQLVDARMQRLVSEDD